MDLTKFIYDIPDFPKEGVIFRDITPILKDPIAFNQTADLLGSIAIQSKADVIVAPETRGVIFGVAAALKCDLPFVPVRKKGKLPREVISESYDLEYGKDTLEMHVDAIEKGQRVLIVDDLLATGGTVEAVAKMVERLGGVVCGYAFVIELDDLNGAKKLSNAPIYSLTHYNEFA